MTAIAYRDGILAVDGLVTWNNVTTTINKLHYIPVYGLGDCWVALSGNVHGIEKILDHIQGARESSPKPIEGMDPSCRYGFAITKDYKIHPIYGDGYVGRPDHNEYIAEGGGFEFLMGAMAMNATATQAVKLACENLSTCGGPVTVVDIRTGEVKVYD